MRLVREKRKPNQPITNLKDAKSNHTDSAHVKAIHTLRSKRQVDNQIAMPDQSTASPFESNPSSSPLDESKETESESNANEPMYKSRASLNNLLE